MFNDNPPADYKAHSMSVSDVIITNRGGDMQAYYVDRFGFAELPDFAVQREKILDIVPEIENVDYENDLTCISFYAAECAEFPVTSLDMTVYSWKEDIENGKSIMQIEFRPIEYGKDYDLVHNPDKYVLLIDGTEIK